LSDRTFDSSFNGFSREEEDKKREDKLRRILMPEARSRLSTLRLVKPEIVKLAEDWIIELTEKNKIRTPVSDETLKQILMMISGRKREPRIIRK